MDHLQTLPTGKDKIKFLVIEGNIGAGKTSLVTRIADLYNAKRIYERFADNPFLPKFYENPERYSFSLELSFLAERYHQLKKELENLDLFSSFTIADYYFMKSLIFSRSTLQDDEYSLYRQLFNIIYGTLPRPDLYVYLHVSVENLMKNIKIRGRSYEQNIQAEYLFSIQEGYLNFFKQQSDLAILVIDTNNLDFVNNPDHFNNIMKTIFEKKYPLGITSVTY
ncbi:MAG: hypothetical protein A2275_15440 [Bacteroidetes bacterium RIFOXYA12_FULL_35_11]|nr:MAG: hypothetical protein A2X01_14220 [Bacteroidetes bacterium GWF2_35_48]OFY73341.1 MAG: hypothetical protein A2275_15440 [Bacteroidetes bacterium RIFOXYA12_FULL_35_11]OFY93692.1 MAG: hypothetical protein A2491_21365 [Bacteroidetes bacterium RIFOXYC12_FULL_35_7]OFY95919.1 MAG: hypothetical protein A2309_08355 [Bacteroidetes bacterium RIFOXYB2_FULL_35_7]HBX52260.1 hypothetical protein [Bacteroidales bacterium]